METKMKTFIFGLVLALGFVGVVKAGGRQGQGWNVTLVTGAVANIGEGTHVFFKGVYLSSSIKDNDGQYLQIYSTAPSAVNGGGTVAAFPNHLFASTTAVTPPVIFNSTGFLDMNVRYDVGDCDNCFIEVPGSNGMHIRKSQQSSGGAMQATVLWSN